MSFAINRYRGIRLASCLMLCAAVAGVASPPAANARKVLSTALYSSVKKGVVEPVPVYTPVTKVFYNNPDPENPESEEIPAEDANTDDYPPGEGYGDVEISRIKNGLNPGGPFTIRVYLDRAVTNDDVWWNPRSNKIKFALRQIGTQHGTNPGGIDQDTGDDPKDKLIYSFTDKFNVGQIDRTWTFWATNDLKENSNPANHLAAGKYVLKIRRVVVNSEGAVPSVVKVRFTVK